MPRIHPHVPTVRRSIPQGRSTSQAHGPPAASFMKTGPKGCVARGKQRVLYFRAAMNSKLPALGGPPETLGGGCFLGGGAVSEPAGLTPGNSTSAFHTAAGAPPQPLAARPSPCRPPTAPCGPGGRGCGMRGSQHALRFPSARSLQTVVKEAGASSRSLLLFD